MTKTKAIKTARDEVSELYKIGDSWRYQTLDTYLNIWRECGPADFWTARVWRSNSLIQRARRAMGSTMNTQCEPYDGGSWRDYL